MLETRLKHRHDNESREDPRDSLAILERSTEHESLLEVLVRGGHFSRHQSDAGRASQGVHALRRRLAPRITCERLLDDSSSDGIAPEHRPVAAQRVRETEPRCTPSRA